MKNTHRFISLVLALTMCLTLCACGAQNAQQPTPPAKAPEGTQPITENTDTTEKEVSDAAGRTVSLPAEVTKVVVTFNLEEYFAVAGEEGIEKLVGWSHGYWEGRRNDAYAAFTAKFPQLKELPDVGYNETISVESIISLAPDVVIMSAPVNRTFIEPSLGKLSEAGIEVAFVDFHSQTLEAHSTSIKMLGEVLDQEERAGEIVDFYAEQMAAVNDRLANVEDGAALPRVYMEFSRGVGEYGNSWSEKMWGAIIRNCKGENILAGMEGNSVDVAPEKVIASDPQIIIFAASPQADIDNNVVLGYGADEQLAKEHLEAYLGREGWAGLDAVKNRNMGALYHDLSRHIFDFAGVQFVAKMIHPELYEDVDPEANLREFFDRFMPVDLDGVWTVTLD